MQLANLKKHFVYWILPSFITLACILIYYFDLFGLEEFIAPEINREFGLVENLQLLILLLIFFVATKEFRIRKIKIEQYVFFIVAAISIFLFLEEIDYGLHYYDYFTGKSQTTQVKIFDKQIRNIHNNGPLQNLFKLVAYVFIVVFFVIFPFVPSGKKEKFPILNFLSPSRFIVTTALCLLFLNQFALYLYHLYNSPNRSLSGNVSEFEEIMIYYIIFLYICEMTKKPEGILQWRPYGNSTNVKF